MAKDILKIRKADLLEQFILVRGERDRVAQELIVANSKLETAREEYRKLLNRAKAAEARIAEAERQFRSGELVKARKLKVVKPKAA